MFVHVTSQLKWFVYIIFFSLESKKVIHPPDEGELPWAMYTKMKNRDEEEGEKQKSAEDEMAEQSESDDDQKYGEEKSIFIC